MAIGIILGIIIAVFAIAGFVACGFCFDGGATTIGVIALIVAIVMVLAFIIVPFSFHTVRAGQVAVVQRLGKIKTVHEAGTYFDLWLTNKYIKYDTKVRNIDTTTAAYSSDAQTMTINMTIQYQIASDKVSDINMQYGSLKLLENRINSIAIEKAKSVLSSYKAMDIIAKRAAMSPEVESVIKNAIGEEYFVNIVAIVLTDITFSDAFEAAVESKMIAEQAKLQADYENEKKVAQAAAEAEAKLRASKAEIEIAQAQAEAKLKAAQAAIDIAKAEAEALKIAAEAEANANDILEKSLTDTIIKKNLIDRWDGKLPAVVGNGEYILPTDILK